MFAFPIGAGSGFQGCSLELSFDLQVGPLNWAFWGTDFVLG